MIKRPTGPGSDMTASRAILVCACLLTVTACSTPLERGVSAYNQGRFDRAAGYWNELARGGDPVAQYNLGLLWEGGLGRTEQSDVQASHWYASAAQQGFVPAMSRLGSLQKRHGYHQSALSC